MLDIFTEVVQYCQIILRICCRTVCRT